MAKLNESQQWLYDQLSQKGYNLGTVEQYTSALSDDKTLLWLKSSAEQEGLNVGTDEQFRKHIYMQPDTTLAQSTNSQSQQAEQIEQPSIIAQNNMASLIGAAAFDSGMRSQVQRSTMPQPKKQEQPQEQPTQVQQTQTQTQETIQEQPSRMLDTYEKYTYGHGQYNAQGYPLIDNPMPRDTKDKYELYKAQMNQYIKENGSIDGFKSYNEWLSDPKNYEGFGKSMANAVMAGIGMVAQIPYQAVKAIDDIGLKIQNAVEGTSYKSGEGAVTRFVYDNLGGRYITQGTEHYAKESDHYLNNKGIVDSALEGEIGEAAWKLASGIVQNAPNLAVSVASGKMGAEKLGGAFLGGMAALQKYEEIAKDESIDDIKKVELVFASFAAECIPEIIGVQRYKKMFDKMSKTEMRRVVVKETQNAWKKFANGVGKGYNKFMDWFGEGATEVMTDVMYDIADLTLGIKPKEELFDLRKYGDTFLIGQFSDIANPVTIAGHTVDVVNYSNRKKMENKVKKEINNSTILTSVVQELGTNANEIADIASRAAHGEVITEKENNLLNAYADKAYDVMQEIANNPTKAQEFETTKVPQAVAEQAKQEAQSHAHKDGNVYFVTVGGQNAYVIDGNIAVDYNENPTNPVFTMSQSVPENESFVVRFENGTVKQVGKSDIETIVSYIPVNEHVEDLSVSAATKASVLANIHVGDRISIPGYPESSEVVAVADDGSWVAIPVEGIAEPVQIDAATVMENFQPAAPEAEQQTEANIVEYANDKGETIRFQKNDNGTYSLVNKDGTVDTEVPLTQDVFDDFVDRISEQGFSLVGQQEQVQPTQQPEVQEQPEAEVPDFVDDNAKDARARGYRMVNGNRVNRQEPIDYVAGKETTVAFSNQQSDVMPARYAIVPLSKLQASDLGANNRNPLFFISEAQPKQFSSSRQLAAMTNAQNLDPRQVIADAGTAYVGAPIVNARGEAIQGNGRIVMFNEMYANNPNSVKEYQKYLTEHAEEYGFTVEQIGSVDKPVLVRIVDVPDEEAIRLGQKDDKDMGTGGNVRIQPSNVLRQLSSTDQIVGFLRTLFDKSSEEDSLSDVVAKNGVSALNFLQRGNFISATQYETSVNGVNGKYSLTPEGKQDLLDIVRGVVFENSKYDNIQAMFDALPANTQKAILQTAYRDLRSPEEERIIPYIQESIAAYYHMLTNTAGQFKGAKTAVEVENVINRWKKDKILGQNLSNSEIFSIFAIELSRLYKLTSRPTKLAAIFNSVYDDIQGVAPMGMFAEPGTKPEKLTAKQALSKALNIQDNGDKTITEAGGTSVQTTGGGSISGTAGVGESKTTQSVAEGSGRADNGGSSETVQGRAEGNGGTNATTGKPVVSQNTIFTDEAAAAARERLRKKMGQLRMGIDPEMVADGVIIAGNVVEHGARSFVAYAKAMYDYCAEISQEFADALKPYFKQFYAMLKWDPRTTDEMRNEMTGGAEFDAMDIDTAIEVANNIAASEVQPTKQTQEQRGEESRKEEENALKDKVRSWLSPENIDFAEGKELNEISEKFGNTPEPIAIIPPIIRQALPTLDTDYLYSGKAYLINHAANHHPELTLEDYDKIPIILREYDDIKDVTGNDGVPTIAVIKQIDKGYAIVAELSKENDRIILHKTFFYRDESGKRTPYKNKPSILEKSSVDGSTTISPNAFASAGRHRNISALDVSERKDTTNNSNTQISEQKNEENLQNASKQPVFAVGDKVQYTAGGTTVEATIDGVNNDGTYQVLYQNALGIDVHAMDARQEQLEKIEDEQQEPEVGENEIGIVSEDDGGWVVSIPKNKRLERSEFAKVAERAETFGGKYVRGVGFVFDNKQDASDFNDLTKEPAQLPGAPVDFKDSMSRAKFTTGVQSKLEQGLESGEKPFKSIVELRAFAREQGMKVDNEGRDDILLQELVEDAIVRAGRKIVGGMRNVGSTNKEIYDKIVALYNIQPTLGRRDSNKIALQQYSTPIPMSYLLDMFAYREQMQLGFEPTAGNGMSVFAIPQEKVDVNEIDENRLYVLRGGRYHQVTEQDATQPFGREKQYDFVVMNPPFGKLAPQEYDGRSINGLAPQIAIKGLDQMKDDGRAAIIIGGNTKYTDSGVLAADKALYSYLYNNYNVVGVVDINGDLYAKEGTSYPVRMILINGRRTEEQKSKYNVYAPTKDKAIPVANTWEELYETVNKLNNLNQQTNGYEVLRSERATGIQQGVASNIPGRTGSVHNPFGQSNEGGRTGHSVGDTGISPSAESRAESGTNLFGEQSPTGNGGTGTETAAPNSRSRSNGNGEYGRGDRKNGGSTREPRDNFRDNLIADRAGALGVTQERTEESKQVAPVRSQLDTKLEDESKSNYTTHSSSLNLASVSSSALVDAMDETLTAIEKEVGNIDEFVTNELGYESVEAMRDALAAEQVDTVAAAIYQLKQGQALIIGDQTGIGKGRQMAALIRWARRQGKKPIFMTKSATLFSDLLRDMADIGSAAMRPLIINANIGENPGRMVMEDTEGDGQSHIIYTSPTKAELASIMESGEVPDDYDYVVLTYSQVNHGDKQTNPDERNKSTQVKANYIRQISKGNFMFLDESHTASGEIKEDGKGGNTARYMLSIVKDTDGCVFASATFAKRPDSMPLYALKTVLNKANVESRNLIEIVKQGGVVLQEIMSRALAKSGQMFRRERNMDGVVNMFVTESNPEIVKAEREKYNETIKLFRRIIEFQQDYVDPQIDEIRDEIFSMQQTAKKKRGTDKMGVNNAPFANKTYQYTRQLMFALKVPSIIETTIQQIKEGRHPVIGIDQTNETFFSEFGNGQELERDEYTFAANLLRGLEKTLEYSIEDEDGNTTHYTFSPSKLGVKGEAEYYEIQRLIRESTKDILISPIDAIIKGLNDAGISVGEMTGRKKMIRFTPDGRAFVRNREDRNKIDINNAFNKGDVDVVILNRSASTGISLHAKKGYEDKRQRVMIIGQALLDINDYQQLLGRIDRTGQVARGYYINLALPVPAETRLLMMLARKMKSLNANTTSSQTNKSSDIDIPDMLNKYGSKVAVEYLIDNPDVFKTIRDLSDGKIGAKNEEELAELEPEDEEFIYKVSSYIALLDVEEQDRFYDDVTKRYLDLMQYLNDTNSNDLEITTMPLNARTIEKRVSSRGTEPDGSNVFAQNAYVEKVEADVLSKPMSAIEINKTIKSLRYGGVEGKNALIEQIDKEESEKLGKIDSDYRAKQKKVDEEKEVIREKIMSRKHGTEEAKKQAIEIKFDKLDAELDGWKNLRRATIREQYRTLRNLANELTPGSTYLIPDTFSSALFHSSSPAIFLGYKGKESGITPSSTVAVFAVLDSRRRVEVKLSDVTRDKRNIIYSISEFTDKNEQAAQQTTLDNWDSQIPREQRETRYILTGNIIQAYRDISAGGNLEGKLISFTDADGNVRDGILMPEYWSIMDLPAVGVPINARLNDLLENDVDLVSVDKSVKVAKIDGEYRLYVPKTVKAGGKYFKDEEILNYTKLGKFTERGEQFFADIKASKIEELVLKLANMGVRVEDKRTEAQVVNEQLNVASPESEAITEALIENIEAIGGSVEIETQEVADAMEFDGSEFQVVTDKNELDKLDNDPKGYITAYCTAAKIDGKYYSPMATFEVGEDGKRALSKPLEQKKWIKSEEKTLDDPLVRENPNGDGWQYKLIKSNGKTMWVAYDPYWHSTTSPLNDQFTEAWNRPELVTLKVLIPVSDMESGYQAEGAKLPVGETPWHSGPVSSKLEAVGKGRKVILSQYRKIVGEISVEDEAKNIAEYIDGTGVVLPINTVRPQLRDELIKLGVNFTDIKGQVTQEGEKKLNDILNSLDSQYKPSDRIEFSKPDGTVYGWYENGTIHLVEGRLNPNTTLHETIHMLAAIMKQVNPEGWADVVRVCKENTTLWNAVTNDPNYSGLTTDDAIASEVIARYSGSRGAAKLKTMIGEELAKEKANNNVLAYARVRDLFNKVQGALRKFWNWVGTDLFHIKNFKNIDEVADMFLYQAIGDSQLPTPPRGGKREAMIGMPEWDGQQPLGQYSDDVRTFYESQKVQEKVDRYSEQIAKQADAKARAYKKWLDASAPIDEFQKYMVKEGAKLTDDTDAYKDSFLSRGDTAEKDFNRNYLEPLQQTMRTIISSGKLSDINLTWQNLNEQELLPEDKRKNGKQLTAREIIGVYAQAKDCIEAAELGLPDRGSQGFKDNLSVTPQEVVDTVEKALGEEKINELWDKIRACTGYALDYQVKFGYMSQEERDQYDRQFYVPERGWRLRDESGLPTDYGEYAGGVYNQPYNKAIRRAFGRASLASDPFAYIESIVDSSIASVETNRTKQKLLEFCLKNEQLGLETNAFKARRVWLMQDIDENGKAKLDSEGQPITYISYAQPTNAQYQHDAEVRANIDTERKKLGNLHKGLVTRTRIAENEKLAEVVRNFAQNIAEQVQAKIEEQEKVLDDLRNSLYILENVNLANQKMRTGNEKEQHNVYVMKDGQQYELWFRDEKVARSINRDYNKLNRELSGISKALRAGTRYLSSSLTQYNPEFAVTNFAKDFQVAYVSMIIEHGIKWAHNFFKNFLKVQKAVWAYAANDKIKEKDKFVKGKYGDYLREYYENGAQTGFTYLKDLDLLRKDFDKMLTEKDAAKYAKRWLLGSLSMLTEVSETAVRFAGYVTARENGMEPTGAAYLSKELTTNFDRGGELSNTGAFALFSFLRATLNGNLKFLKGFKNFAGGYSAIAAAYFIAGLANALLNPNDPDDEIWASDYVRESNFVAGKFKLPVAHFMRMFFAAGNNLGATIRGDKSKEKAVFDTVEFATNEMLPNWANIFSVITYNQSNDRVSVDFKDYIQSASPSTISPFVDILLNRDFMGRAVNGEHYFYPGSENQKDINKYRKDTPKMYVDIAQGLYSAVGGELEIDNKNTDNPIQNLFDVSPSNLQHVVEGYTPAVANSFILIANAIESAMKDEEVKASDIPFVRRLYSSYRPEAVAAQQYWLLKSRVNAYNDLLRDVRDGDRDEYRKMRNSEEYQFVQKAERALRGVDKDNVSKEEIKQLYNLNKEWNKLH